MPQLDPFGVGLVVALAGLAAAALIAPVVSDRRRRRRGAASLQAIDFVRTSFTSRMVRGDPIDVLLHEVVESLLVAAAASATPATRRPAGGAVPGWS